LLPLLSMTSRLSPYLLSPTPHPHHHHSFPTRRSSDLTAEAASALRSRKTERAAKEKPTPISHIFFSTCCALGTPTRRQALGRLPDRKSTRLNSSHQIISYAVFFLKKKTKYQQDHYA